MNTIKAFFSKIQGPLIFATILTTMSIFVNTWKIPRTDWLSILFQWVLFITILMIIWFFNAKILLFKPFSIIIINILFVLTISFIMKQLFPDYWVYPVIATRLLVGCTCFHMYQRGIDSVNRSRQLEFENMALRAENYKAELDNLKKQLDPHFLFNTLSVLQSVIKMNQLTDANIYILKLANLYRNVLQNNANDKMILRDEIETLHSYLYLQKTRFENCLHTKIEINTESFYHTIPTFALQLLVENCLKHNTISEEKPLQIDIYQKEAMSISVKNNWQPKIYGETSTRMGLSNLRRRYELLGITDGVTIEEEHGQFIVTLKLF